MQKKIKEILTNLVLCYKAIAKPGVPTHGQ